MQLTRRQALLEEFPECEMGWQCQDCIKKKKELESNEESFDYLREYVEVLMQHLSMKEGAFNRADVDSWMMSLCVELGVKFSPVTIDRNLMYKLKSNVKA